MSFITGFLSALPELIKLVKLIQKKIEEDKSDKKTKEEIRKINQAFKDRDAEALNRLFDLDNVE